MTAGWVAGTNGHVTTVEHRGSKKGDPSAPYVQSGLSSN